LGEYRKDGRGVPEPYLERVPPEEPASGHPRQHRRRLGDRRARVLVRPSPAAGRTTSRRPRAHRSHNGGITGMKRSARTAGLVLASAAPLSAQEAGELRRGAADPPPAAATSPPEARAEAPPAAARTEKDWTEPVKKQLPAWLSLGGQYRGRVEAQRGRQFRP